MPFCLVLVIVSKYIDQQYSYNSHEAPPPESGYSQRVLVITFFRLAKRGNHVADILNQNAAGCLQVCVAYTGIQFEIFIQFIQFPESQVNSLLVGYEN